ncbi:MAG: hypothetical protein Ct9H300mP20_07660 [Gammaproteobacteria bacterium]|nr:MAG: hypothetical protein Ct9H300mP20_07660 [Gammaproteobacteria bacterium]
MANQLAVDSKGKIRIEDAGFDWKILGPDYDPEWSEYVAFGNLIKMPITLQDRNVQRRAFCLFTKTGRKMLFPD